MSILLQSFATKQVQESPRDSESTGALMIGGEGGIFYYVKRKVVLFQGVTFYIILFLILSWRWLTC